jgi:3-hydroxyacyl-CoA dehydrogenase / enoyl-CoA hydratase / 3-hydroxybutyryl-CoA epimerase
MSLPLSHNLDTDGVGWIILNNPDSRANVLNPASLAALSAALDSLVAEPVKAVVVWSAKENIFLAGADLKWLAGLRGAAAAEEVSRVGQALFKRLENFPVPVVCAIHGACAGGGFELALACHWRIASDAKETVIGLPEVRLGLIPCWGGCARLPRLVGTEAAVKHILGAELLPAAAARAGEMIDEIVPAGELRVRARSVALQLAGTGKPERTRPPAAKADFFAGQRNRVAAQFPHLPGPVVALDILERGSTLSLPEAQALEPAGFGALATGPAARNLLRVFFLQEKARKQTLTPWFPNDPPVSPGPKRIGIVGAGKMGTAIAQGCARHNLGVILQDSDATQLKHGVGVIRELFRAQEEAGWVTPAAAHRAMGGIGITTSLEDFDFCELVIEAVSEQAEAKREIFAALSKIVSPECILASCASTISLAEIAAGVSAPGRVVGLHFFHPVNQVPLVEMILGAQTDRSTAERALAFVRSLGKTAVVTRSLHGSLVVRLQAVYLNEACRLWEQGETADRVDQVMRAWGWSTGPLQMCDEMGLEEIARIFERLQAAFPGRFKSTTVCQKLAAAGLRGRKDGASAGFYVYDGETEKANPAAEKFRAAANSSLGSREIQARLMGAMAAEADQVLKEGAVASADEIDRALVLGGGFPAFRGGLLHAVAEKSFPTQVK